ncbi:histidine phosphatase family protein [Cohnella thailandensis]|uniref:Histidine phosphatase family protein n=1 Tax=Cohnella thailandensis TaxID=557557 RepID=A0A841T609_9BACL|nr:histidine phosphatase family protein [Cohnella thailandensis]MBB6638296.1 histidine phosphatase family protein [Cohnella thailandensis]MBP1977225.1 2,3-bisphosphoglycerate-dependent phosphoglycerate mutase [Cohnella thailandensis]
MKRIYLIRHCKANGQEAGAQLTIEGRIQAKHLAEFLTEKQIDYIVSSSYERAISSIRPLAKKLNLMIHMDNRLCERVLSTEELVNWMETLRESYEDLDRKLPGGESSRDAMTRGVSVINELYSRTEKNIAVVTHGNLMSLILKYYNNSYGFNEWERLTNPDIYELVKPKNEEETTLNRIWM